MPNRKGNKKSGLRQEIKRLEHRIQGVSIRARNDPPSVTAVPWYNLTISFDLVLTSGAVLHTVTSLRTQLLSQLGVTTTSAYFIRIREVRVWGPLGSNISLQTYDFSNDGNLLSSVSDVGSLTNRPHTGYVWPASAAVRVLDSADTESVAQFSTSQTTAIAGTTGATVHYLVQFKFAGATITPPP